MSFTVPSTSLVNVRLKQISQQRITSVTNTRWIVASFVPGERLCEFSSMGQRNLTIVYSLSLRNASAGLYDEVHGASLTFASRVDDSVTQNRPTITTDQISLGVFLDNIGWIRSAVGTQGPDIQIGRDWLTIFGLQGGGINNVG